MLSGEIPLRGYDNGTVIRSGVDLKTKPYYQFLQNFVYNDGECLPPYTDFTNNFWYDTVIPFY